MFIFLVDFIAKQETAFSNVILWKEQSQSNGHL
jgi:hypothetical protein